MVRTCFGLFLLIGLAQVLSACTTLTEEQCQKADWEQIGLEDGLAGRGGNQFWQNRYQCASFGIGSNRDAWWAGNTAGLAQYCTAENAFELGRSGGRIEAVCSPAQYADGMQNAFEAGQQSLATDLAPAPSDDS